MYKSHHWLYTKGFLGGSSLAGEEGGREGGSPSVFPSRKAQSSMKTASWLARLTSGSAFTSAFTRDSGSRAGREGPAGPAAVVAAGVVAGASSSSGAPALPAAAAAMGAAILATSAPAPLTPSLLSHAPYVLLSRFAEERRRQMSPWEPPRGEHVTSRNVRSP
ncbi:hypothetical protein E2320_022208 [Naja naja]|nr:hypothetical protein E2320_022208 [Naja naja]